MPQGLTLQVLEGIDKGRVFRELPMPVTNPTDREAPSKVRLPQDSCASRKREAPAYWVPCHSWISQLLGLCSTF